ncbi:hypothetical protein [Paenimyroides aestuarii]|uniref:Phenylalanyl-tRNA synthetase subunit alpha n=1 Tax=Paenimyroides aestuarii TaxID=2968490 RepID=A0ABY5NVH6_9FLAO|nr:hypothetical protein [Paenimyroides aestuarii]UUV22503.1 hypothetical protein NPX36_05540 [Paenimyroides aestuarii]
MKKDIDFPKSENVFLAAIPEWNEDFQEKSWYVYLVNNTNKTLEMVLAVSRAYGTINNELRKTGTFRHAFKEVAPHTLVKIELLENNVLQLNNEFAVTYFLDDKMFDKTFVFKTNTINDKALSDIPGTDLRGVLLK